MGKYRVRITYPSGAVNYRTVDDKKMSWKEWKASDKGSKTFSERVPLAKKRKSSGFAVYSLSGRRI